MQANFFHNGKFWEMKEGEETVISHLVIDQIPLNVVLDFVEGIDTEEEYGELTPEQGKEVLEKFRSEVFPTKLFGEYLLDNMEEVLKHIEND